MKVVLDTNVVLSSISPYSPYRTIFDHFEAGTYQLGLTTEILLEYEEKIESNFSVLLAELTVGAMSLKSNVNFVEVFFRWQLIYHDLDDNKFVDCALAFNADYLVTNDRHFRVLKNIPFPSLTVIKMEEFMEVLDGYPVSGTMSFTV